MIRRKIPEEQPPTGNPVGLAEWLTRMMILINATINGVYDWIDYLGNGGLIIDSTEVLNGLDSGDQVPLGLDTPLQITFGPAQVSADGDVELRADGTLASLSSDTVHYSAELKFSVGRSGNPQTSFIVLWAELNGVVAGNSHVVSLFNQEEYAPIVFTSVFDLPPGVEFKVYIARDSQGSNDGQLRSFIPSLPNIPQTYSAAFELTLIEIKSAS